VNWLDVGSWPAYGETLPADANGNRTGGAGASLVVQGKNNLVVSGVPGHTVSVLGAEDLIVVHTADATLVMPRAKAEELKTLHGLVDEKLK
jgi:mannose-1-phosphate guanylyltransferase